MPITLPRTWKECTHQQFIDIYNEVYAEAQNLGLLGKHKKKHPLYIHSSVRNWGLCRYHYEGCEQYDSAICINDKIVVAKSLDVARKVIVHEVAHIAEPGAHHSIAWQRAGNKIGKKWGITVQRTDSYEGLQLRMDEDAKYILECTKCGHQYKHMRMTKSIRYPNNYRCGHCSGSLKRIK